MLKVNEPTMTRSMLWEVNAYINDNGRTKSAMFYSYTRFSKMFSYFHTMLVGYTYIDLLSFVFSELILLF